MVDKISVLISGNDNEYNESLAVALSEHEKNFFVTCVSPERLLAEKEELLIRYDVFLLESEILEKIKETGGRFIVLKNDEAAIEAVKGFSEIFKYRGVRTLASAIYREYRGKSDRGVNEKSGLYSLEADRVFRNVIVVGDTDEEKCSMAGILLARGLAMTGKRTIFSDLQEYQVKPLMTEERIAERSWDDFIYCCIYGKTDDMLKNPALYCAADESGVCYFYHKKGKNPFRSLEEDEVRLYFSGLREKCRMDFGISVISEIDKWMAEECIAMSDLVIVLSDGGEHDEKRCEGLRSRLQLREDFSGKIITLGLGAKWEMGEHCDFSVDYNDDISRMSLQELIQTKTWKDVLKVAGFIGDRCFE